MSSVKPQAEPLAERVRLQVTQAGPKDGPLVVLLHGFPEHSYCWHEHVQILAAQGFRVLAPDQRGYNLSDKPKQINAYRSQHLTADIAALIREATEGCRVKKAFVVGHDWGGAVTWQLAGEYPELVQKFLVFNCPHPTVLAASLTSDWRQFLKSWYILFFQVPKLAEYLLAANDFRRLAANLNATSRPGTYSAADIAAYKAAWRQPGAINAMINWYRAARFDLLKPKSFRVTVPGKLIWGGQDAFLETSVAKKSLELCDHGAFELWPDNSHWIIREDPQKTAQAIGAFFGSAQS